MTAVISAQPGAGQDDYNPFTDEGATEKEPEVKAGSGVYHSLCSCSLVPRPLSAFFTCRKKKRERTWDLKSCDICWQNGVVLALPQGIDFKPVWHLWSIKCSSVRPLRIVLPSLIVSVAFFFIRIESEQSKIALIHVQFSRPATLPTLVYGPTSRT